MPTITMDVICGVSRINGTDYPMYSGFLNAEKLTKIADVPSFADDKAHHQIASDIAHPPVDQWQRPLDDAKIYQIKDTYSRTNKDNLMANPVLIGIAALNVDGYVNVSINQKMVHDANGNVIPIQDIYTIVVNYLDDKKPLWILDGQHRIKGMLISSQKNEPIPFVLLSHPIVYTPPFLAEIFTQVTTGATPMKPLHAEWMKYAFRLGKYSEYSYEMSMKTTIELCKEVSFQGIPNPFHNKIHFNPYVPQPGYYAFSFNMEEWSNMIAANYYGSGGTLDPAELAGEIVKVIREAERLDMHANNHSKLFSNDPHKVLAEGFLTGLLKYLSTVNSQLSTAEWNSFLVDTDRAFDKCDWRLSFVRSTGALSSTHFKPSKQIALECFDEFFNSPQNLNAKLTDYLQGVGAKIKIIGFKKSATGRPQTSTAYEKSFSPGGGLIPFDCNHGGTNREIIRIEAITPNCEVFNVLDPNVVPARQLPEAMRRTGGLDISNYNSGYEIEIITIHYSGDTKMSTRIRLDK